MNSHLKAIRRIPLIGGALFNSYYKIRGGVRYLNPTVRIAMAMKTSQAIVVQIGANDGSMCDPISELMAMNPLWKGLFVEPVPYLFKQLTDNYGNAERFKFENCLIGSDGFCPFYVVDERAGVELKGLPAWWRGLNSFSKDHILNCSLGKTLEPYVLELNLPSLSLESLLNKYTINEFDLLHIDTEGADWIILQQLNLKKFRPSVILFEHKCLSSTDKHAAVAFLKELYSMEDLGDDLLCVLKKQYLCSGRKKLH